MAAAQTVENPGPDPSGPEPAWWTARRLVRAARVGSLGTLDGGGPFVSLVTPAPAPDLASLLLLSDLSAHSRHLRADPRCALLLAGPAAEVNPQTAPRLSLTARAEITVDAALRARFLALHPYAAVYAGFADFHLWRLRLEAAHWVGGFARAARIRVADLCPAPAAVATIAAASGDIMGHCNADHADALVRIAGAPGAWRMVAVDPDGCDLATEEDVRRIAWAAPVADAGGVRSELVRLARAG